jgi:fatty-acyl-CoA synthase
VINLWNIVADASANGNALYEPLRADDGMPVRQVLDRAERTASDVLAALRGRAPRRLGVLADNGEPWLRAALAAVRLDAAFVPLPRAVGFVGANAYVEHLRRIVANAALDAVLVDSTSSRAMTARIASALDPVPLIDITEPGSAHAPAAGPRAGDDALAVIQYTSGSTSTPKGVALTHSNVAAGLEAVTGALGWIDGDAFGIWIPLFHDMGLFATLSSLARGSSACLWRPSDFVRRPLDWLASFARSPATVMPAPNFCFDYLVNAARREAVPPDLDLSGWRLACNGAEPVQRRSLEAFGEVFGPYGLAATTLAPVYGMAEATLVVTAPEPGRTWHCRSVDRDQLRIGSAVAPCADSAPDARAVVACGRAAPAIRIRVADEGGTAFADGVVGEVQITGPAVTSGYLDLPDADQPFTPDRWLRTGDLAFMIDGDLYIVGRLKDMITVRGQNFYAEDVEEIVRATPGIDRPRNAAIAWNDDDAGERMVVLWETSLDVAAARVLAHAARDRVRRLLGLEAVDVVPVPPATIPHTTSGKVKRQAAGRLARDHQVVDGHWRDRAVELAAEGEAR